MSTIKRMSPSNKWVAGTIVEQEFINPQGIQDGGLDSEFINETDRKIAELRQMIQATFQLSSKVMWIKRISVNLIG